MESGAPSGIVDAWLYSSRQAAALLGVSRVEVQRAVARGLLPFVEGAPPGTPRLGLRGSDLRAFAARSVDRPAASGASDRAPSAADVAPAPAAVAASGARLGQSAPTR